ncbi:hypothetical protein PRZ48_001291 [Zasmidium cellare]|uniref:Methyltransferase domain-containing protein n=1 Tax=Zasmidium cellare TaxID=395010 RepID=A0ABR0F0W4_ZASCE|nr:hypothetical protein PRZ48_001291 [Zasmidium cellare]
MPQDERRPYALPRNPTESERLNAQHHVYVKSLGYVLHPRIAASLPAHRVEIADVATGTGAWMIDLASELPYAKLVGLDMSKAQFQSSVPSNCELQLLNILDPIPQEFQGRFDVVHIRLLIVGLTGEDWNTVARHAMQMLKPGRWFQWCEADFQNMDVLQTKGGSSRAAHEQLWGFARGVMQKHGKLAGEVGRLGEIVRKAGYQNISEDLVSSDRWPEMRREASVVEHGAVAAIAKQFAANLKEEHTKSEQDVEDLCKRCEEEVAEGETYWRWNIKVVVGQKPQS